MSANYFAIPTNVGQAKIANAIALGVPLKITAMGVGDGGGQPVTPDPAMTALPGEQRRAPINTLFQDPLNPSQLVAEQILPEDVGGWWVRCVGLYDETGTLIAIANAPDTYKPLLTSGSGRTQTIRIVLIVSNTSAVELKIDPAVVLATRKYIDDAIKAHKESREHPDATETEKGLMRRASQADVDSGASGPLAISPDKLSKFYKRENSLGLVSQSGGVPTGAIFERGVNANGWYLKYLDGTMICGNIFGGAMSVGVNYLKPPRQTFPAQFVDIPFISGAQHENHADPNYGCLMVGFGNDPSNPLSKDGFSPAVVSISNSTAASIAIRWTAIGRWY